MRKKYLYIVIAFVLQSCSSSITKENSIYVDQLKKQLSCYTIWDSEIETSKEDSLTKKIIKKRFLGIELTSCNNIRIDTLKSKDILINEIANHFYDVCKNKEDYDGICVKFIEDKNRGIEKYFYFVPQKGGKLVFYDSDQYRIGY